MAVRLNFRKGFSGTILADSVNAVAIGAGIAGGAVSLKALGAFMGALVAGYLAGALTLMVAVGLKYRFQKDGQTGIDVGFWVTMLIGVVTIAGSVASVFGRAVVANIGNMAAGWSALAVLLLMVTVSYIWFLYVASRSSLPRQWPLVLIVLIVEFALLAVLLFMIGGLTGTDIDVPKTHPSSIVALVFSLFGLVLWQDAEVLNLLGWDTSNGYRYLVLQKVKSTLQSVGALLWLLALALPVDEATAADLFWAGVGIAGAGVLLGIISGVVKARAKRARTLEGIRRLEELTSEAFSGSDFELEQAGI